MTHNYPDFYVLSHDRNYVKFVEQYYHKNAVHFPIPGVLQNEKKFLKNMTLHLLALWGIIDN